MASAATKTRDKARQKAKREPTDKCNARAKSGNYCSRPAGWGTEHVGTGRCKLHGGSTALANRGAALEEAREIVNSLNLPKEIDPLDALLEELYRTNGVVSWLGEKVATLQEERPDGLQGSEMVGPVGGASGGIPEYKPSVWIAMWEAERDHLAKVAKLCLDAGIDERRIKVAEAQGQMLASALRDVIVKLGLDPDSAKVRTAVREGLLSINGTARELPK